MGGLEVYASKGGAFPIKNQLQKIPMVTQITNYTEKWFR